MDSRFCGNPLSVSRHSREACPRESGEREFTCEPKKFNIIFTLINHLLFAIEKAVINERNINLVVRRSDFANC